MRALVLCAGMGTRLGSLTEERPKPLLEAGGRPLLFWILEGLASAGVHEVLINLHFRGEAIRQAVGDGSQFGLRVYYVQETELLGTAGTVRENRVFLAEQGSFLVHYGDVVHRGDLRGLIAWHHDHGALATLALHQRALSNSHVTLSAQGVITSFVERPDEKTRSLLGSGLVFSGIAVLAPEIIAQISSPPSDLPSDLFSHLAASGRLHGRLLGGFRVAVDSPARLSELNECLRGLNKQSV